MMEESLVVIVRSIVGFFTLLIYTRVLGKQQMSNLSYFDYINGITIGSIAGTLATDLTSKGWNHFVGLTTFVVITIIFQYATVKSRYFSKIVDSEPVVIIQDGKLLEHVLSKLRVKYDEVMMMLRQNNIFDITKVEYAIMEPNGNLSVLPKAEHQNLTPQDLQLIVRKTGIMTEVITDGIIMKQNLEQRNKDETWLKRELHKQGVKELAEVSFAAILPNDTLYVDKFEDKLSKKADMSDYIGPF